MPYRSRDAIIRLISDVLPTATIAMNENTTSGNHGAPARTTSSRSRSVSRSTSIGTSAVVKNATSM